MLCWSDSSSARLSLLLRNQTQALLSDRVRLPGGTCAGPSSCGDGPTLIRPVVERKRYQRIRRRHGGCLSHAHDSGRKRSETSHGDPQACRNSSGPVVSAPPASTFPKRVSSPRGRSRASRVSVRGESSQRRREPGDQAREKIENATRKFSQRSGGRPWDEARCFSWRAPSNRTAILVGESDVSPVTLVIVCVASLFVSLVTTHDTPPRISVITISV